MLSTENTGNKPDEVTLAFWRAAETGALHEVETMLSRVADLNARNEHGVTALMRAAQHGHAWVVRLLLAKGADANVIRNDKFTALSLAAFFGHTEVVRALMEHGADSKASTRHETSPHMWATARTFNEVVDQLKNPAAPQPPRTPAERTLVTPRAPKPVPPVAAAAAVNAPVTSAIVRTLKEPPEIWDLVHEEPKGFNARSAFVGHLRSMRLTLRIATGAGLVGACIVGVLVLRGVHARSDVTAEQQLKSPAAAVKVQNENKTFENVAVEPVRPASTAAAPSDFVAPVVPPVTTESSTAAVTRRRSSHSRMVRTAEAKRDSTEQPAAAESVQPGTTTTPSEKVDLKLRPTSTATTKSSSPLSPQLITPAKNGSPKTKVIQWP